MGKDKSCSNSTPLGLVLFGSQFPDFVFLLPLFLCFSSIFFRGGLLQLLKLWVESGFFFFYLPPSTWVKREYSDMTWVLCCSNCVCRFFFGEERFGDQRLHLFGRSLARSLAPNFAASLALSCTSLSSN